MADKSRNRAKPFSASQLFSMPDSIKMVRVSHGVFIRPRDIEAECGSISNSTNGLKVLLPESSQNQVQPLSINCKPFAHGIFMRPMDVDIERGSNSISTIGFKCPLLQNQTQPLSSKSSLVSRSSKRLIGVDGERTSLESNSKGKLNPIAKSAEVFLKPTGGVTKGGACFYCGAIGHWKRNCPKYLENFKKVKESATSASGNYGLEVYLSISTA